MPRTEPAVPARGHEPRGDRGVIRSDQPGRTGRKAGTTGRRQVIVKRRRNRRGIFPVTERGHGQHLGETFELGWENLVGVGQGCIGVGRNARRRSRRGKF